MATKLRSLGRAAMTAIRRCLSEAKRWRREKREKGRKNTVTSKDVEREIAIQKGRRGPGM